MSIKTFSALEAPLALTLNLATTDGITLAGIDKEGCQAAQNNSAKNKTVKEPHQRGGHCHQGVSHNRFLLQQYS